MSKNLIKLPTKFTTQNLIKLPSAKIKKNKKQQKPKTKNQNL